MKLFRLFVALLLVSTTTVVTAAPTDMQKVLSLVPTAQATCTAAQSGNWSDPASWGGRVPATDDFVWVPEGITISQDVDSPKLRKLFVQGSFGPLQGATCKLWVDTFVSDMMSLVFAGSPDSSFTGQWSILCADYGPIDLVADPWVMGRGFQCMGSLALYGRTVEAWILTNGNTIGDTVVTLKSPCIGWQVNDLLVIPGAGGTALNDDDECRIQSISADLMSVTLAAPLRFNHGSTDLKGNSRPMFAANLSRRSIDFDSESVAVGQRGHMMMMRSDPMTAHVIKNVSVRNWGRTDKSKPVSDPDGLGGGTSNPRGRYSVHFHKCGPSITGMKAMLMAICVVGSPGWGIVNHDSYVDCDDSIVYKTYGASYVGEIGTETGCFCNDASVRNTAPYTTANQFSDPAASPGPLADWGKLGHGFFDMCGAIQRCNCVVTGSSSDAFVNMGLPFQIGSNPATVFDCSNLPPGYTYSKLTCPAGYVPRNDAGFRCFGCPSMLLPWQLNLNGDGVPIGQSTFSDIRGEVAIRLVMRGYLSGLDLKGVYGVCTTPGYINSTGIIHSGVSSFSNIDTAELYGFDLAIQAGTVNSESIINVKHQCLTGILANPPSNGVRNLTICSITAMPLSATDMNYVLAHWSPYSHQVFGLYGPKVQVNVAMLMLQSGTSLYAKTPTDGTNFPQFTQGYYGVTSTDSVKLDNMPLYYVEEGPNWALSIVPNVPALVKGLTNQQMSDQYNVRMGARILPLDAVASPGNIALQSTSMPTQLRDVQVDKFHMARSGMNYQMSNVLVGWTSKVKDDQGNFVTVGPVNFPADKQWYIVPVSIYGTTRGLFVKVDTSVVPIPAW